MLLNFSHFKLDPYLEEIDHKDDYVVLIPSYDQSFKKGKEPEANDDWQGDSFRISIFNFAAPVTYDQRLYRYYTLPVKHNIGTDFGESAKES